MSECCQQDSFEEILDRVESIIGEMENDTEENVLCLEFADRLRHAIDREE